jgi:hypothetical protein
MQSATKGKRLPLLGGCDRDWRVASGEWQNGSLHSLQNVGMELLYIIVNLLAGKAGRVSTLIDLPGHIIHSICMT